MHRRKSNKGKYYPLEEYLMSCGSSCVKLSFEDLEKIIGDSLPPSASKHRTWWANGGHVQAFAWLRAGYKVEEVSLGDYVVFVKKEGFYGS
nr:MAG: hypothetical protein DIU66_07545 [Bacillota bacterium]